MIIKINTFINSDYHDPNNWLLKPVMTIKAITQGVQGGPTGSKGGHSKSVL